MSLYFSSHPPYPSITNNYIIIIKISGLRRIPYSRSLVQEVNGSLSVSGISFWRDWNVDFTPPNGLQKMSKHMVEILTFFVVSSSTTLLSLGDLPVLVPE